MGSEIGRRLRTKKRFFNAEGQRKEKKARRAKTLHI
jgi:hypothetical protein